MSLAPALVRHDSGFDVALLRGRAAAQRRPGHQGAAARGRRRAPLPAAHAHARAVHGGRHGGAHRARARVPGPRHAAALRA
ncbi:hypothetical protein ON010_g7580 [Phytophthora cinnamomi]|nr:hypothetical protein ON010_g7580 [Phytophthora cinnamomi]